MRANIHQHQHKMPSATTSSFYIPSVDITPYLADPTSAEAQQVIDDIREACLSTGFFQLLGHGVSPSLQASAFEAAAKFFALPFDAKMALSAKWNSGYKGYDVMASQSYQTNVLPDLKEGFVTGSDLSPDDARIQAKRFFAAPNLWPSTDLLPREEFREPVEAYYKAMTKLCDMVLDLVAATLPHGPHIFDDFRAPDPACPLRLLHYPPTPAEDSKKRQLGSSAHTDFSAITLLLQDEHEGLEVQDQSTGEWVLVPPNKDGYVINLGDMMHKLLNGLYKSSVHRVVNRNKTDRYSIVFFFDGNLDFKLKPLGAENGPDEKEDAVMTCEQYMFDRLNFSYGRHEVKASA
jgi:isopenicillin N synthase-like dioxygenase